MKLVFVSNYFNHHQQPMSDRLYQLCKESGGSYVFMQTQEMDGERLRMGWGEAFRNTPYLRKFEEDPVSAQALIDGADAVIFGGTDEECYIQTRLKKGLPVWRYQERLYKTGRYKFISPRGLRKKFLDHTRYGFGRVYLLCAGAYVAGDFRLVLSYPGKKFRFGYFPEYKQHDIEELLSAKQKKETVTLLWAARMIDWKHPEVVLRLVSSLKKEGMSFHLLMAGGGAMEAQMHAYAKELQIEDYVTFLGDQAPEKVRSLMEESDIYLATSDYGEGWGAVLNESMNSGCVVIANRAMGAAPYLIRSGENGFLYKNKDENGLLACVRAVIKDQELRKRLGREAYHTIAGLWNPQTAADRLFACIQAECSKEPFPLFAKGPMSRT